MSVPDGFDVGLSQTVTSISKRGSLFFRLLLLLLLLLSHSFFADSISSTNPPFKDSTLDFVHSAPSGPTQTTMCRLETGGTIRISSENSILLPITFGIGCCLQGT